MPAVLKVLATLTLIVFLINRKVIMGTAMLAGSLLLFAVSEPQLAKLVAAAVSTATAPGTWEIILALYFVMCLEYQLRTTGVIDGMMAAARLIFRSDRILLAMMPAFLGFLPSLGGAIFSAPLVERAASQYALSAETKTTINYWFRHVWEFTNPIFTGMLLASHISGIPLSVLVTHMAWLTLFSLAIGWLFLISPLRRPQAAHTAPPKSSDNGYRYLVLAAGPVVANFVLVIAFNFSASAAMALVVAAMAFVLRQSFADVRAMLAAAFDRKMLWGIVGILFFQNILRQTGVIGDVAALMQSLAVPPAVVVGVIAFAGGLLTGTSQGFVAITFPFIGVIAPGDLSLVTICFVLGTAGHMLSPAHMCLLVTLDYFNSDFLKTLRPVLVMQLITVVVAWGVIGIWG